jgi:hypothetical protein
MAERGHAPAFPARPLAHPDLFIVDARRRGPANAKRPEPASGALFGADFSQRARFLSKSVRNVND